MKRLFKNNNDKKYSDYPCSDYLHNALRFISEGNNKSAYEEVCWAILKAGGTLTMEERMSFEMIGQSPMEISMAHPGQNMIFDRETDRFIGVLKKE